MVDLYYISPAIIRLKSQYLNGLINMWVYIKLSNKCMGYFFSFFGGLYPSNFVALVTY